MLLSLSQTCETALPVNSRLMRLWLHVQTQTHTEIESDTLTTTPPSLWITSMCSVWYAVSVCVCGPWSAVWLGGVVDSRSRGPGFDSQPVHRQATTLGKLLTPMCLCYQAVQFGTGQRAAMLCSREGNRIGLASHWPCGTDFSGLSTYGLMAKVREMSTPPTPIRAWSASPLPLPLHMLTLHRPHTITKYHIVGYMLWC